MHTWEVLHSPYIEKVLNIQVLTTQDIQEGVQEVRCGRSSDETYESKWSEGPKHFHVSNSRYAGYNETRLEHSNVR